MPYFRLCTDNKLAQATLTAAGHSAGAIWEAVLRKVKRLSGLMLELEEGTEPPV